MIAEAVEELEREVRPTRAVEALRALAKEKASVFRSEAELFESLREHARECRAAEVYAVHYPAWCTLCDTFWRVLNAFGTFGAIPGPPPNTPH